MHVSDCRKVVAFTSKILSVAPTATPDSVCRLLAYAAELHRLNQLDAKHGLTDSQRAKRVKTVNDALELAKTWGGTARFYSGPRLSPLIFAAGERAITVPLVL